MTEDRAIWINSFASGKIWQNKLGSKLTKQKFAEYFNIYSIAVQKNPDELLKLKRTPLEFAILLRDEKDASKIKENEAEDLLESFFAECKMKPTAKLMLKNAVFSFYMHNKRSLEPSTASNIKNETPESKKRKPTLEDLVALESRLS
jgi:hypothetical protein